MTKRRAQRGGAEVDDDALEVARIADVTWRWRRGCRAHPEVPAVWRDVSTLAARDDLSSMGGLDVDASRTMALVARGADGGAWRVLEPSAVQAAVVRMDVAEGFGTGRAEIIVDEAFVWDLAPRSARRVVVAPEAERGSARVHAELLGAARALLDAGVTYAVLDKRRGAERYLSWAERLWTDVQIVGRTGPARLARLRGPRDARSWFEAATAAGFHGTRFDDAPEPADGGTDAAPWQRFEVPWGRAWSLPGTYSGTALDPGTATLLAALERHGPSVDGASVLDLGCGWGPLAWWAAAGGGRVTAVDDDLAAVRSARRNVPSASVVHGDMNGPWSVGALFDVVLVNPPFHVGAGMRPSVGRSMVDAAVSRTARGGETWCVAHASLDVEEGVAGRARIDLVAADGRFEVWRFRPTARR